MIAIKEIIAKIRRNIFSLLAALFISMPLINRELQAAFPQKNCNGTYRDRSRRYLQQSSPPGWVYTPQTSISCCENQSRRRRRRPANQSRLKVKLNQRRFRRSEERRVGKECRSRWSP